ncbi:hypothetical protein G7Y89_g10729 [Cudoniella acicularis]|uniref:Fungal N-terminal domain-containing protein n=1 Tax=Cudoniella acicularis TaxID=354080 RepID=A0A8H4RC65_9HELO|nr:hypothetical protein G7Y89_g10729 [Cudoniella acicularis]
MAEVLGIVTSGISVAQVAGQLAGCVQQLRRLCKAMREMPAEMQIVLEEVHILGDLFSHLRIVDEEKFQSGSADLVKASLAHCQAGVKTLEALVSRTSISMEEGRGPKRWHLMKAALRKEDIRDLKQRLEAAKSLLQLAMTCYSMNLTGRHMELLRLCDARDVSGKNIEEGTTSGRAQLGIPYVLLANLDIAWSSHFTFISPSLQAKRVVSKFSPGFQLLGQIRWLDGDGEDGIKELAELFHSGKASPLDVLPDGTTMPERILSLPWPNGRAQLMLLNMLVSMGAPINTSSIIYRCATWNGAGPWQTGLDNKSDAHKQLLKTLLRLGFDPSEMESFSLEKWPDEHSPMPVGRIDDPLFVEWITEMIKVSPEFAGTGSLSEAVLIGSQEEVKTCIEHYPFCDEKNALGQSALHLAVLRPHHLGLLISSGANIDAQDCNGRTPLMYSAIIGSSESAIMLLKGGANIWLKDTLYCKQDFIHYAIFGNHWPFFMKVLDFIRQSRSFRSDEIQRLLDTTIILWAGTSSDYRESKHFKTLLEWGANPEVRFRDRRGWRDESDLTLLHVIKNVSEFDALVTRGFTSFNDPSSSGAHPLIFLADSGDANLVEKCISYGSNVDHQDHMGKTALHAIAEQIWEPYKYSGQEACCSYGYNNNHISMIDCERVLLSGTADPLLSDCCRCACSREGCIPGHILLKLRFYNMAPSSILFSVRIFIRTLEHLRTVQLNQDIGVALQVLLDMIRVAEFENLELTHTCLDEIRDEEREIIQELEDRLTRIQKSIDTLETGLDSIWIQYFRVLMTTRVRRLDILINHVDMSSKKPFLRVKDRCWAESVDAYISWVEGNKHKMTTEKEPDWYEKRLSWIDAFRDILEAPVFEESLEKEEVLDISLL